MSSEQTPTAVEDLASRVARLEQQVAALLSAAGADAVPGPSGPDGPQPAPAPGTRAASTAPASPADQDPFWALRGQQARVPAPGGVTYAGSVDVGMGHVDYQWGRTTEHLLEADWAEHAEAVTALGHPLRLTILRRLLDAEHTVAQLVDELDLASTGVAYHHLSALQNGGWVASPRRGTWTIPVSRIIPLLTIITALEKG